MEGASPFKGNKSEATQLLLEHYPCMEITGHFASLPESPMSLLMVLSELQASEEFRSEQGGVS